MNKRTIVTAAALLIVGTAALTGCSTIKDVVDVAGPIVEAVNDESTWIEVGDCFNETGEDVSSDIPTVPRSPAGSFSITARASPCRTRMEADLSHGSSARTRSIRSVSSSIICCRDPGRVASM